MKKSTILLIFFISIQTLSYSQHTEFSIEYSFGASSRIINKKNIPPNIIQANQEFLRPNNSMGFEITSTRYKKKFFFEIGIGFQKMGFKFDEMLDLSVGAIEVRYYKFWFREYYLGLPLRIGKQFSITKKQKIELLTGLDPQFFLKGNAREEYRMENQQAGSADWNRATEFIWTNPYWEPPKWYSLGFQWTTKARYPILDKLKYRVALSAQYKLSLRRNTINSRSLIAMEQRIIGRVQSIEIGLSLRRKSKLSFQIKDF